MFQRILSLVLPTIIKSVLYFIYARNNEVLKEEYFRFLHAIEGELVIRLRNRRHTAHLEKTKESVRIEKIEKRVLVDELKNYRAAYQELLSRGIDKL